MPRLLDALPSLYAPLLPAFFQSEVPAEEKATCHDCAMCARADRPHVDPVDGVSRFFRPDTKCCTYHPRLPNYLVGALLADPRPELEEGRRRVRERISQRLGATPQWLRPPPSYNLLYAHARKSFGKAESLLCPFFERGAGACTIWPFREAVCSTYFCQYVAGADGRALWMTVKRYLTFVEVQLSRWVLLQLHPEFLDAGRDRDDGAGQVLGPEELDGQGTPPREHAAMWGRWAQDELGFYRRSFELVSTLTAPDVERLLGLDGTIELSLLQNRLGRATSTTLPPALRFNPDATVSWRPDGSVALGAYSDNEALELPGAAYALLVEFSGGEPVDVVRERLRQKHQADLGDDVLLTLYRHRVLIDASVPAKAQG